MEFKLFFILFYFKCYPTFDVLSWLFDMERGRANRWVHRLQGILETALGQKMVLPERKLESIEQFLERFPAVREVIFDGTERPVQRPKDAEQQKEHYSGKKKRHTRKHITGSTRSKRVILLSEARAGKIHDKRQLDEADLVSNIPDVVRIEGDLGFQGLQNEFVNIHLPHKKPRGKELSEIQKQENKEFSSQRVVCEHAHAGIKRYNAASAIYRNRVPDFDDRLMLTAVGLWNFYLDAA
ncbi:transposase family protein [Chamaesiphon sp.]|uniref:transposase family protein n=1 Tax=Chamaesiphon sp. TaxID=2814140 RepID=UPI003594460B